MTGNAVMEIREMSKRYGTKTALDEIELSVEPGEVVGLIGPNGAGKTTLMECAIGITKPTSGNSRIMNYDTWTEHTQASRHYGVQFQTTELPPFTRVSDTFWFFRRAFVANENPRTLCAEFGLDESHYRSFFRTLSGGERRRVLIALAFLGDPPIVLLDEPTAGMDPGARSRFWEAVRRRRDAGRSIVCSSHALEDMEVNCDRGGVPGRWHGARQRQGGRYRRAIWRLHDIRDSGSKSTSAPAQSRDSEWQCGRYRLVWAGTGSGATHHLQGAFGAQYSPDVGLRRDQSQVFQEIQSGGHIPCLYGRF